MPKVSSNGNQRRIGHLTIIYSVIAVSAKTDIINHHSIHCRCIACGVGGIGSKSKTDFYTLTHISIKVKSAISPFPNSTPTGNSLPFAMFKTEGISGSKIISRISGNRCPGSSAISGNPYITGIPTIPRGI
ncbi:MAG: hypothetical protein BWX46_00492 [Candidatus Cloacimonetes bacterium ADurb.Bin003]|nr:MAG: hypothetical protein BWX46_00492 [Candidatus Cloacimonetes bacterium ADurb.Bin003]